MVQRIYLAGQYSGEGMTVSTFTHGVIPVPWQTTGSGCCLFYVNQFKGRYRMERLRMRLTKNVTDFRGNIISIQIKSNINFYFTLFFSNIRTRHLVF